MSLENAINDHAAAIRELAAAILASARTPAAAPVGKLVDLNPEKPGTTAPTKEELIKQAAADGEAKLAAKKKAEADAAAKKKAEEEAAELAGGTEAAVVLDYETEVKPKFQAFLKAKGRDAGLALLAKYGAKSGNELPKDRLHEVLADIEAAG